MKLPLQLREHVSCEVCVRQKHGMPHVGFLTMFRWRVSECGGETRLRRLLTFLGRTSALNVHMAPLSVLLEGAALLVTATAVVAFEGFFHCEQELKLNMNTWNVHLITAKWFDSYYVLKCMISIKTDDVLMRIGSMSAGKPQELTVISTFPDMNE